MKISLVIILFGLFSSCYGEPKYPDYFYKIVGLLGEFGNTAYFGDRETDTLGIFWPQENLQAQELLNLLSELKKENIIQDDYGLSTDKRGCSFVFSKSAKEKLYRIIDFDADNLWGWKVSKDFFESATEEQAFLLFEAIYSRWGTTGFNIIESPNINHEWILAFLKRHCTLDVITLHTHTRVPDSWVVLFFPDDTLKKRLGIVALAGIDIIDLSHKEGTSLPWSDSETIKVNADSIPEP